MIDHGDELSNQDCRPPHSRHRQSPHRGQSPISVEVRLGSEDSRSNRMPRPPAVHSYSDGNLDTVTSRYDPGQPCAEPLKDGPGFKPGDWYCPQCGDHQFAKNTNCRKCGEARQGGKYDNERRGIQEDRRDAHPNSNGREAPEERMRPVVTLTRNHALKRKATERRRAGEKPGRFQFARGSRKMIPQASRDAPTRGWGQQGGAPREAPTRGRGQGKEEVTLILNHRKAKETKPVGHVPPHTEQQRDFWAKRCKILQDSGGQWIVEINMSGIGLTDVEAIQWCSWIGEQLAKHREGYMAKTIDFSKNNIGGAGASRLCRLLEMHKVSCEVFKLFKNELNDEAAREVGRYLTSFNRAPVNELHLSHNCISPQGLKWILACLAMHPAYPRWCEGEGQFLPLWLRIESNDITDEEAMGLLRNVNEELDISTCTMKRYGCKATRCNNPSVTCGLKHNCVAHLPFFLNGRPETHEQRLAPHSRPFFTHPVVRMPHKLRGACRQKPFVLYEDHDIACVFKPADWICNPDGINEDWQDWPLEKRRSKLDDLLRTPRPVAFHAWILLHFGRRTSFTKPLAYGLAHRLDRDTSGPLLVGKTKEGWHFAREQINGRHLLKSYICLVHGTLEHPEGECHAPIDADCYVTTKKARISWEKGQAAISIYEALAQYESPSTGQRYTLVHVRIVTGRTHQIRLHMEHLGHPLVGERMYLTDRRLVHDDMDVCKTIFLHKCRIGFLTMEQKVTVMSCSLQMSSELWQCLERLCRLGGGATAVGETSLGSTGVPGHGKH